MKNNVKQKIEFVKYDWLSDVNHYLATGWKVVSIHPITPHKDAFYGAYVLLEAENNNENSLSDETIEAFTKMGINIYDNYGNIKPFQTIMNEIKNLFAVTLVGEK